jgi:hypothetical protein
VILFSGGPDISHGKLAAWVTNEGATANDRFYAVLHASELSFGERAKLVKLGYTAFGIPFPLYRFDESNVATPVPEGTRGFVVALPPRSDECEHQGTASPAHNSVVVDKKTPIGGNGRPAYFPVWDAMLR